MNNNKEFSEKKVYPNPFVQFENWFNAHSASGVEIPNSVSLGTAFQNGRISVRTVLLKTFDETGFVFYTNYNSRKGSQLSSNNRAALLFYWSEEGRQVRIEGIANKVSEEESSAYFATRPRESQIGAWASDQSSVIPDRDYLVDRYKYFSDKFKNSPVEKPDQWGGFRLVPDWFEYWQNGEFRLHDRITFTKKENIWIIERLSP